MANPTKEQGSKAEERPEMVWHRELQEILERHLGEVPDTDPDWMAQLLVFDQVHIIPDVWSAKAVHQDLDNLQRAAANIDQILYDSLPQVVSDRIFFAGYDELHEKEAESGYRFSDAERQRFLDVVHR